MEQINSSRVRGKISPSPARLPTGIGLQTPAPLTTIRPNRPAPIRVQKKPPLPVSPLRKLPLPIPSLNEKNPPNSEGAEKGVSQLAGCLFCRLSPAPHGFFVRSADLLYHLRGRLSGLPLHFSLPPAESLPVFFPLLFTHFPCSPRKLKSYTQNSETKSPL